MKRAESPQIPFPLGLLADIAPSDAFGEALHRRAAESVAWLQGTDEKAFPDPF